MHLQRRSPITLPGKQHGAVLVISLLVLLVLTLIGISSLDGSIMEEKMASNSQMATATFQKAESSIRAAYFNELVNPLGAASNDRIGELPVTRDDVTNGITSTSQHNYVPVVPAGSEPRCGNYSAGSFSERQFEIIGTASKNGINRRNIQGYTVCGPAF